LKKQSGGDKAVLNESLKVNLFSDPEMQKFLNPIYGLILCENGYMSNNFFLKENKYIDTKESKIIKKICKEMPGHGTIKPTNPIMKLKPVDFGRYIAIKYINMKNKMEVEKVKNDIKTTFTKIIKDLFTRFFTVN